MRARGSGGSPVPNGEFTKIQELVYELRIEQIMTRPVITVASGAPMAEAKEVMRVHRVSGLPVTAGDALVGIVSVEDLIGWLEAHSPDASVGDWMTRNVHAVRCDQAAAHAISKFGRFKVGRLPVLDRHGKLVGILTPGDVISRVLKVLDALYREEEGRRGPVRASLDDLLSDGTTLMLRYEVAAGDFTRAGIAATKIKRILETLGVASPLVRRTGIAAYEAEMNLAIHTSQGGRLLVEIGPERLLIEASDNGPGIADLDQALTPGFSTAPDWIRELGFGAGMGLNNMRNCADQFTIESGLNRGTTVRIAIERGRSEGAAVHPDPGAAGRARGDR